MGLIKDVRSDVRALDSSGAELRKFGWTMAAVAFVFAALGLWKNWNSVVVGCLAGMVIFFGFSPFFLTKTLQIVRRYWMAIAFAIGWVVSRIILVLLYYLVVTPIAVIAKATGKRFLEIKGNPDAATYWLKKKKTATAYNKLY